MDMQGKRTEALAVLERGLKVLTERKGPLHAQRARIAFETLRSRGRFTAEDPLVASARTDASAAARENLPDGYYLLGRLEEELGNLDEAEKHYRSAIKVHDKVDENGGRYRVALARVLLRLRPMLSAPRTAPSGEKTGHLRRTPALDVLGILLAMTFQGALDKPSTREAEKLADEVLAMGDKAPFDARAQALAVKGLHTRALGVYLNGLREKGLLAQEHANAMNDLLSGHPALRRPESKTTPDPNEGEKRYAAGLNFFFNRNYANAEKELIAAIENDNADARYYYFLGLARLAQGKREAYEDFDQGARLEQLGRPDTAAVSSALERVQGQLRRVLNGIRTRPMTDASR
jgi:tetratricopeptide (TPR) repeat protein